MARRADHTRDELKQLIIDAAWEIIGKEGINELTARRIAKDIGYVPGTIYNVFTSMDDICLAINARTLDNLYAALNSRKCNDPKRTMIQNLKSMATLYADFSHDNYPYWLLLFTQKLPEERKMLDWYEEKISLLFQPLEQLLCPLFSGKEKECSLAARTLWASVHGICSLQETGRIHIQGKSKTQDMAHCLIENFIAGIQK